MSTLTWSQIQAIIFIAMLAVAEARQVQQDVRFSIGRRQRREQSGIATSSAGNAGANADGPHQIWEVIGGSSIFQEHVAERLGAIMAVMLDFHSQEQVNRVAQKCELAKANDHLQNKAYHFAEQPKAKNSNIFSRMQTKDIAQDMKANLCDSVWQERAERVAEQVETMIACSNSKDMTRSFAQQIAVLNVAQGSMDKLVDNIADKFWRRALKGYKTDRNSTAIGTPGLLIPSRSRHQLSESIPTAGPMYDVEAQELLPPTETQPKRHKWLVWPALSFVSCVFAGWAFVAKDALSQDGVDPGVLVFYRCLFSTVVMMLMQCAVSSQQKQNTDAVFGLPVVARQHLFQFMFLGLCVVCNIVGSALAVKRVPALTFSIFQTTQPMFSGIVATCMGIEKLSLPQSFSILLAVVGAIAVLVSAELKPDHNVQTNYLAGIPLTIQNVFAQALQAVFTKKMAEKYPPVFVAGMSFLGAILPTFVMAVCQSGFAFQPWTMGGFNLRALLGLGYAILFQTVLNYSVMAWANKMTTPTTVVIFVSMQPLAAVFIQLLVMHKFPSLGQSIGGIVIIASLIWFAKAKQGAKPRGLPSKEGGESPAASGRSIAI